MIPVPLGPTVPTWTRSGRWSPTTRRSRASGSFRRTPTRTAPSTPSRSPGSSSHAGRRPDFRIFWDNAYAVHHLTDVETPALDVLGLAEDAGQPQPAVPVRLHLQDHLRRGGVSFFAGSPANVAWYLQHLSKRTIGPDKINHLRHARFLQSPERVRELMREHREILQPKLRPGHRSAAGPARRVRGRDLDQPGRRLLHQPGRGRRHRHPGGRAGQGGRAST